MANNTMGYIVIDGTETLIRGAALITDMKGFPVDFVRTEPLRPDQLAKILYGELYFIFSFCSIFCVHRSGCPASSTFKKGMKTEKMLPLVTLVKPPQSVENISFSGKKEKMSPFFIAPSAQLSIPAKH